MQKISVEAITSFTNFKFNSDQIDAINKLIIFLNNNDKYFGLYGYAGTGKTSLISILISYLLTNNCVSKINVTAPTNKAVNVLKKKLSNDNKIIYSSTQKLLGFVCTFNNDGKRIFDFSMIKDENNYELIIIDECSMISQKMLFRMFLKFQNKNCKIIFIGDSSQLPPVNEKINLLFIKDVSLINISTFSFVCKKHSKNIDNCLDDLKQMINSINNHTLTYVMRTNDLKIIELSNHIRDCINNKITPKFISFISDNIKCYKYTNKNKWLKTYVSLINATDTFILAWTNKVVKMHNIDVRKLHFLKSDIKIYEVGDILIFNDFYSANASDENESPSSKQIYTSEKVVIKKIQSCKYKPASTVDPKIGLDSKYYFLLKKIDNSIRKQYFVYRMDVSTIGSENTFKINVLMQKSINYHTKIVDDTKEIIKRFINDHKNLTDKECDDIWKKWYDGLIKPFANVTYGYAMTVHKSQGSDFNNVFVDLNDITNNENIDECLHCIYTAITRTSNSLHILI